MSRDAPQNIPPVPVPSNPHNWPALLAAASLPAACLCLRPPPVVRTLSTPLTFLTPPNTMVVSTPPSRLLLLSSTDSASMVWFLERPRLIPCVITSLTSIISSRLVVLRSSKLLPSFKMKLVPRTHWPTIPFLRHPSRPWPLPRPSNRWRSIWRPTRRKLRMFPHQATIILILMKALICNLSLLVFMAVPWNPWCLPLPPIHRRLIPRTSSTTRPPCPSSSSSSVPSRPCWSVWPCITCASMAKHPPLVRPCWATKRENKQMNGLKIMWCHDIVLCIVWILKNDNDLRMQK